MAGKFSHKTNTPGKSYLEYLAEDLSRQKNTTVTVEEARKFNKIYMKRQNVYEILSEIERRRVKK